ncbi:RING-type domain-containing protein, partial [Meloidogyne graminicola]
NLKKLFVHFNLNQFYLKEIPSILIEKNIKIDEEKCSICLNEFYINEETRKLIPCNHIFHKTCIDEWLNGNSTCPLCRNNIDNEV